MQNAIQTKDNLIKHNWNGSDLCAFYSEKETIQHLFFECPISKYVWSLIAEVLGAKCRPCSFEQFWESANRFLKNGELIQFVGLSAVC